jgi:hypothetical protein
MSLAIDPAQVTAVLLVDGWHHVHGGSFDLEAYEYVAPQPGLLLFNGEQAATLSATGFSFISYSEELREGKPVRIAGPITSVLAVRRDVQ